MHVRSGKNHEVSSTREQVSCEFVNTLICSAHFSKQFFFICDRSDYFENRYNTFEDFEACDS